MQPNHLHRHPTPCLENGRTLRPRSGFTLIELLVVISVLAILIALLFPMINKGLKMAKDTQCRGNMKSIGQGFVAFAYDREGVLPGNVSGPANLMPEWKRSWLGDEVLKPGDSFPNWWVPQRVQSDKKGTVYTYVFQVGGESASKLYRCPATKFSEYGSGVNSNGRFDYTALHVFSGAHIDTVPLTAECTRSGNVRSMPTPLLIEEDHYWWANRTHIEPGAGNADRMGLHHDKYSNYFAADGSVQHMTWDITDSRGVKVGPDMNEIRGRTPSGAWATFNGGSFGSWTSR